MQPTTDAIELFFRAFERSSNRGDISDLIPQFADTFMVAGPQGAQCIRAADFAVALPKRKQLFDSLGCQSTSLLSLEESPLNARFVMVKTRWRMTFKLPHGELKDAMADSIFIVDTSVEGFKIVFYLAKQDHIVMLREHGILPN